MAETSSADTKNQNGKATRRRRKYPPPTELLQTQCESPEEPPSRPFTTNEGGKPITDDDCVELAIALAKLDLTCLEIIHSTVKYMSQAKGDAYEKLRPFILQKLRLDITKLYMAPLRSKLFDITKGVSVISQEYVSSTELSRYWELLPSSAFHEDMSLPNRLAVEAMEVRQKALVVARRGALENDIETALRQRWICIAKVTFVKMDPMSPELYKIMSGLTVKEFSSQMIAEDRRRQAKSRFAEPNARVNHLMWSAFTATLLTAIPTMALGWRFSPHIQGSPADADFWFLLQNCAMTFLGLVIMILPTFQAQRLPRLTKTALWIWIGFATACVVVAPVAYLYLPTEWSQCLIMISGAIQIFVTLQVSLTAAEGAKETHEKTS